MSDRDDGQTIRGQQWAKFHQGGMCRAVLIPDEMKRGNEIKRRAQTTGLHSLGKRE